VFVTNSYKDGYVCFIVCGSQKLVRTGVSEFYEIGTW
jgi:hypothetical protein